MKQLYFVACISSLLIACAGPQKVSTSSSPGSLAADGKLWSSLFQQKAAEYKALCLQAYNIARFRLEEALKQPGDKPKAIVTDIDETFLDNSPYAVHRALKGLDYDTTSWFEWTAKGIADTMTGAAAFFNYAASKNVEVFYITNRKEKERQGTLQNLQRYHLPFADEQHLILRQNSSSKEQRRQQVAAAHDIVLLLGGNLADFSSLFDNRKTSEERAANVQQLAAEFGKRFIVLPNANYGGWEDAVYGSTFLKMPQKDSAIKSNLKGY
jgi:5'-nucleotidase (lipoprotein e(P4) family)